MSTIRVDNFGPSAGGTTYSARGISKCWVNFNGTGTIAARDSENVSSLTDNGTGDYTVNFSNSFGAADYSLTTSAQNESSIVTTAFFGLTASTFRVFTFNTSFGTVDDSVVCAECNGDLA